MSRRPDATAATTTAGRGKMRGRDALMNETEGEDWRGDKLVVAPSFQARNEQAIF